MAEGVARLAVHHGVDRGAGAAGGAQRRLPGPRGQHRVGVEMARMLQRSGRNGPHLLQMRLRVRQQDLLLDVLTKRRLGALQAVEDLMPEHLVDGPHTVGALGTPGAGVVLGEGMGVSEEVSPWVRLPHSNCGRDRVAGHVSARGAQSARAGADRCFGGFKRLNPWYCAEPKNRFNDVSLGACPGGKPARRPHGQHRQRPQLLYERCDEGRTPASGRNTSR